MHLQALVISALLAPLLPLTVVAEREGAAESSSAVVDTPVQVRSGAEGCSARIPEWEAASAMADGHREIWTDVFESLDAESSECEAIVFPELLRYSRLRDGIEQTALLSLYVSGGKETADFSVGIFQMKPSFAEQVEKAWMLSPLRQQYGLYFDTREIPQARRSRVSRLSDERWQCVYLSVFVRLMLEREPSLKDMRQVERVKYLAAAYNFSFSAPIDELSRRLGKKTFHLDLVRLKSTRCFSYSDLAARRCRQIVTSSKTGPPSE